MNPVWPALAVALPVMFGLLYAIATPLYLQLRGDRNAWKKRPVPSERPMPTVGTYTTNRLLHDADLTQTFRVPSQREPHELPAATKGEAA